jgi:hypothetical protein
MKSVLGIVLLAAVTLPLAASGPYSPPRISMRRDETYERGKALFAGDIKVGSGKTCENCHSRDSALTKKKLQSVKFTLQQRIEACIRTPERVNGSVKGQDMEALVYYIAKRYGL